MATETQLEPELPPILKTEPFTPIEESPETDKKLSSKLSDAPSDREQQEGEEEEEEDTFVFDEYLSNEDIKQSSEKAAEDEVNLQRASSNSSVYSATKRFSQTFSIHEEEKGRLSVDSVYEDYSETSLGENAEDHLEIEDAKPPRLSVDSVYEDYPETSLGENAEDHLEIEDAKPPLPEDNTSFVYDRNSFPADIASADNNFTEPTSELTSNDQVKLDQSIDNDSNLNSPNEEIAANIEDAAKVSESIVLSQNISETIEEKGKNNESIEESSISSNVQSADPAQEGAKDCRPPSVIPELKIDLDEDSSDPEKNSKEPENAPNITETQIYEPKIDIIEDSSVALSFPMKNSEEPNGVPNASFSSLLSRRKNTDSFKSQSSFSSFSSLNQLEQRRSTIESYEAINEIDDQGKQSSTRVSVASLGDNPHLNDISLDDETVEHEEESNGWSFSRNLQTPVRSIASFISSFSTPSTPTIEHHSEDSSENNFPKTPNSVRSFTSLFSLRSTTPTTTNTTLSDTDSRRLSNASMISQNSNYDLLLAKIDKENEIMTSNPRARRMSIQGQEEIKKSFERVQNNISEREADDGIDWDFWGLIISDYENVAKSQPRQLSRMIQKGIPPALRGIIWQLMSKSKDAELESTYAQLLKESSPHEKLIMRDLNRTFPKHEYFRDQNGIGQEGLFNVVKAYSLFDKDVGYCQGISFVVGPLLLHMPDEEAFCVLVRLMTFYNMRGHFLPGMDGLQLRLFQFDRLVEEMLPKVHQHLQAQEIYSSMYASQWFMTLFAYKFPLTLVLRIYDTIFTEGIESLFRFSIALLKRNEDKLVQLEFEHLLEFLKSGLYKSYQIIPNGVQAKENDKEIQYDTNEFIQDAYSIRITIKKLNKYQQQYLAFQEAERQARAAETIAMERLRVSNNQLSHQVKHLEGSLQTLNREHIDIANELINTKMELARVKDENDSLHHTVSDLRKSLESTPARIESRFQEEMDVLANKNIDLVTRNTQLEDQLANLENMLIEIKMRYAESENEREVLKRKWNGLKKALG